MIKHILFDLDNTLYSVNTGLDAFFMRRLREYTSSWLKLPWEECQSLWKDGMTRYGTTLEWLISEKGFSDVDDYNAYIHPDYEADSISPDPELRRFLESLPCPCSILTNSPFFHAERIIKKLKLEGIFRHVFAIEAGGLKGKPHAAAFNRALDALGLTPKEALFIDDIPRYVNGFLVLGGRGLLIDENNIHKNYPHDKIRYLKELTRFLD
ncbi:MAG: HAD-IA family hydrolase [Treponema sp.]|jgi:putative hydrolase of the HAD superfamily|nr:HAD-IA family hydrolase [Treponema sp.]